MVGKELVPGLYFVATPIGAARDITLRALDILASADVLAAEDTRNTRRLLDIHGISLNGRPLVSYHDHNGAAKRPRLLADLLAGKTVAYVSDAGTPLVADPGFVLAREAIGSDIAVYTAPGPSALLAALTVAGLPTDRFYFAGFAPVKTKARRDFLKSCAEVPGTLVFYESPKRLGKCLADMVITLGAARPAVVCRELTKKFEQTRRAALGELAAEYTTKSPKGEIVILVGAAEEKSPDKSELQQSLRAALRGGASLKDAVAMVTESSSVSRKLVYKIALSLEKKS